MDERLHRLAALEQQKAAAKPSSACERTETAPATDGAMVEEDNIDDSGEDEKQYYQPEQDADELDEAELFEKETEDNLVQAIVDETEAQSQNTEPASKKKRGAGEAELTDNKPAKKKRKARAPRRKKSEALNEALSEFDNVKIDGVELSGEIRAAYEEACEYLDRASEVLSRVDSAVKAMRRYTTIVGPMHKAARHIKMIEKACNVLVKHLDFVADARDKSARLPELYRLLLVKNAAFMRSSFTSLTDRKPDELRSAVTPTMAGQTSSATTPTGALTVRQGNSTVSATGAVVRIGERDSGRAFHLTMEQAPQYRSKQAPASYLETSMMRTNFNPRTTAACARQNRLERQKRAARARAQSELVPALCAGSQAMLIEAAAISDAPRHGQLLLKSEPLAKTRMLEIQSK